jgi:hypothetical protein
MSNTIKTISICAKCVDACSIDFFNSSKTKVGTSDGYVPDFFPDEHYGEYIIFEIDITTGKILNWIKPTQAQLKKAMGDWS